MDDGPYQIQTRRIPKQNIVYRLINREIYGVHKTGIHQATRSFYLNIFPNFTVVNVGKPPCFLRKFSPNGQYFIAFSSDQTSLEVYQYKGCTAAADLPNRIVLIALPITCSCPGLYNWPYS